VLEKVSLFFDQISNGNPQISANVISNKKLQQNNKT
jgi:hypothetical protein